MIQKYIADYVLLQHGPLHGYIVLKDTYTICYIPRYITMYIVDWYSNITKNTTKQFFFVKSEHNIYTFKKNIYSKLHNKFYSWKNYAVLQPSITYVI